MKEIQEKTTVKNITEKTADASINFESANSNLKRKYLLWNIETFNIIASHVRKSKGSFGTGYPFYALDSNLNGSLPIISEQIRYSRKLVVDGKPVAKSIWQCKECLENNYRDMPDLKAICRPCTKVLDNIKPRKIINRLPDMDMWLVCEDGCLEETEKQLQDLLEQFSLSSSDIDPLKSIDKVIEITHKIKNNEFPEDYLPIDCHIIEYSKLKDLIKQVPDEIRSAKQSKSIPYLPIHPKSYRKKWQYDDEAYNYVYDFLSAFTPFNFPKELEDELNASRKRVVSENTSEELFDFLMKTATPGNARRFKSPELKSIFYKKMEEWKKLARTTSNESQEKDRE